MLFVLLIGFCAVLIPGYRAALFIGYYVETMGGNLSFGEKGFYSSCTRPWYIGLLPPTSGFSRDAWVMLPIHFAPARAGAVSSQTCGRTWVDSLKGCYASSLSATSCIAPGHRFEWLDPPLC